MVKCVIGEMLASRHVEDGSNAQAYTALTKVGRKSVVSALITFGLVFALNQIKLQ